MINIIFGIFQILIAIGLVGFWIAFFLGDNSKMSEVELKHEKSFPLPDLGWVAPTLVIAAIGLLTGQSYGYLFSAIAGSGMMFLGLIDLAFHLQNEGFSVKKRGFDAYMSVFICVLMFVLGPIFIIYGGINLL